MEEGEGERRSGKACVIDRTAGMVEQASTSLSICLSDPQGRDEAVAQERAQNSVKKRVHFGTHRSRVSVHASHEALTLHSPVAHPRSPWLTLLARCGCLKRHGVGEREGELGADFTSLVLPRHAGCGTVRMGQRRLNSGVSIVLIHSVRRRCLWKEMLNCLSI